MVSQRVHERQKSVIYFSLGISTCLLLLRFFSLPHSFLYLIINTVHIFDTFHFPLPGLFGFPLFFLFFLGLILYSLYHASRTFNQYEYKAFLPLFINVFTIIILLYMQYFVVLPDFYANLKEREAVVTQITSGLLTPKESQRIEVKMVPNHPYKVYSMTLPSNYTHLSKGREVDGKINIVVDKKTSQPELVVFFNTFDSSIYTAFVYKTNTKLVSQKDLMGVGNINIGIWLLESKKIKINWFWVDLYED